MNEFIKDNIPASIVIVFVISSLLFLKSVVAVVKIKINKLYKYSIYKINIDENNLINYKN